MHISAKWQHYITSLSSFNWALRIDKEAPIDHPVGAVLLSQNDGRFEFEFDPAQNRNVFPYEAKLHSDKAIHLHVFFCGHSSHGSPQPAPMVQQHTDFLISRPLGLVQPSSSNLSKQKPTRTSVEWKLINTGQWHWKTNQPTNKQVPEGMDERMKQSINERTNERTSEEMNDRTKERTSERTNERKNQRTDEWTSEPANDQSIGLKNRGIIAGIKSE